MRYKDIIGALDIVGDADLESLLGGRFNIVGAEEAANTPNQLAMLQALALRGGASATMDRAPTKSRKYVQGFGPTVIAGGATVNIIVQPQTAFKGKRLSIPSDFAGVILVNDIKVGNTSQLPSSNPIPGRMFTEFAVDTEMDFDTAQVSQQISLSVTNTGGAPVTFTAGLLGIAVQ